MDKMTTVATAQQIVGREPRQLASQLTYPIQSCRWRAPASTPTLGICARPSDIGVMFSTKSSLQLTDLNLKEGESYA